MFVKRGMLIGRTDGMDQAVLSFLNQCQSATFFRVLQDGLRDVSDAPELILVLQHWPEEFSSQQVQQLISTFPLARLICCYGPWCQSDGRTRQAWPCSVRVPLAAVKNRIDSEIDVISGNKAPLELTAGLDEVFAFDHAESKSDAAS